MQAVDQEVVEEAHMQLSDQLRLKLHRLRHQVDEAAVLDELLVRLHHLSAETLRYLHLEIQKVVASLLVRCGVAFGGLGVSDQLELLW